jgi:hypothetical protein
MAGATLTTLSNILKEFYLGPIQDQLNNEILITKLLPMDSENLEGLKAVVPLHTARSGGIGARGELVQIPAATNQAYARATYDLKYHYARIQVSGPSISKTKSDAGAFAQAMKEELNRVKDDVMLDFARQLYGDGSGQVAQCGTTTASTTVVLSSAEAVYKGFLYVGMVIDIGDSGANPVSVATARTVTDVDISAGTIVISGAAVTTSSANFIYRSGNVDATNGIYEIDAGVQKLVSTAANTVGGINAAAAGSKYWDNLRDTSGGAIALTNLLQGWNRAYNQGARSGEVVGITTPGIVRRLFETADFKSNVRFVNSESFDGGFEKITFNAGNGAVELFADRHHPWGKVHILHKKHFRLFSPADWDFLSRDGLTIRWVTDFDAFQAVLYRYANLGVDRRNTSIVLSGLTDTGF